MRAGLISESPVRPRIPFHAVNRCGRPGYRPGLQRHHLLPRELLGATSFGHLFETLGVQHVGFDDFRRNGLLLPCEERSAVRMGLPLHRGPHRAYNELVRERIGQIERDWSHDGRSAPSQARNCALMRLWLLQRALRRRLLATARPLRLNRYDPLGAKRDFSELDRMAEILWRDTAPA